MRVTPFVVRALVFVSASAAGAAGCSEAAGEAGNEAGAGGGIAAPLPGGGAPPVTTAGNLAGVAGAAPGAGGALQGGNPGATGGTGAGQPPSSAGTGGGGNAVSPSTSGTVTTAGVDGSGGGAATGTGSDSSGAGGAAGLPTTTGTETGAATESSATPTSETSDGTGDSSTTMDATEQPQTEDIECPADATFCTGFELSTLPAGAAFEPQYVAAMTNGNVLDGTQMALDREVVRSGSQALHVPEGPGGYQYRMLAVPVPGGAFWVRLWVRSSNEFGDGSHDSLYMGSRLPTGEYNGDSAVEISEQSNQLLLNMNDALYAASGPGDPAGSGASGPTLPANTWVCMESFFDASAGVVQVYADGELLIDATNYGGSEPYQTFRFGYLGFHEARGVWFDDVVVAASRVGCD